MRKNIALFLVVAFTSIYASAFAQVVFPASVEKNSEQIEKIMTPCAGILNEASQNLSSKKYVQASKCILKQDISSLDEQTQKDFKNMIYTLYIQNALEAHKITKQKKYLNDAFDISKKAVKNDIKNIDTLKASMAISTFKGSPSNTSKAYTQMCEVNKNECEAYYEKYDEMYTQSKEQRKENLKWLKKTGLILLIGLAAFGGAYAGANAANNKKRSMTCQTIGSSTYCNEY